MIKKIVGLLSLCLFSHLASAGVMTVNMYQVAKTGHGDAIGTVKLVDTRYGLLIKPSLHGLPTGVHGFHLHRVPSCDDNGLAAGGHFDPNHTQRHAGPYVSHSHLGDLPALTVDAQGKVSLPVLAPRLTTRQMKGHALIIHAGGDVYREPPKLGGGGKRIACGVVK